MLPEVIFLMGPTASGKTDLAIKLREYLPCDIISVDSALVYRGLDIGAAKPSSRELALAPHRLIDIRDPAEPYSAADFRLDALREISDIVAKGRIPLLVGGTMLYFKVLFEGIADLPSADETIRAAIEKDAAQHGWPYVHEQLAQVDPESAKRINPNDPQRLQRALEVFRIAGKSMTSLQSAQDQLGGPGRRGQPAPDFAFRTLQIAISPKDRIILHERIALRFRKMIDAGFIDEVRTLYQRDDLHNSLPSMRSVGYRQVWEYLDGKLSYDEMIERGIIATRQLAKRQLTWLRSWPNLNWIYTDEINTPADSKNECGEKEPDCAEKLEDHGKLILTQALKMMAMKSI